MTKNQPKNQHFHSKIIDYTLNLSPKLAGLHTRDLQKIILSPCAYLPKSVCGYSPLLGIGPAGVCWILHNGGGGEPIDIWQIHHDGVMIDQGTFELNWLMFILIHTKVINKTK